MIQQHNLAHCTVDYCVLTQSVPVKQYSHIVTFRVKWSSLSAFRVTPSLSAKGRRCVQMCFTVDLSKCVNQVNIFRDM